MEGNTTKSIENVFSRLKPNTNERKGRTRLMSTPNTVEFKIVAGGHRCSNCDLFIEGRVPHYCPSCALPVENFDNDEN